MPQSPDWLVSKRKEQSRIYRDRRKKGTTEGTSREHDFTGDIQVPSLFVSANESIENAQGVTAEPSDQPQQQKRSHVRRWKYTGLFNEHERRVVSSYVEIMRAICREAPQAQSPAGTRSLRSMAVTSLTKTIRHEESMQLLSSHRDVVEAWYDDIESVAMPKEQGLTLQAQILREYALDLMLECIRSQYLHWDTFWNYLVEFDYLKQIGRMRELFELRSLALSIFPRRKLQRNNCLQEPMFTNVQRFFHPRKSEHLKSHQPIRLFDSLLESQSIPVDWLGTSAFEWHWQDLINNASLKQDQHYDASGHIVRVIQHACGKIPMTKLKLDTLKAVPAQVAAKNCDQCRGHDGYGRQRDKVQSAFTNCIASFFRILTSFVVVGSERYLYQGKEFKPDLVSIRSLLHSSVHEIPDVDVEDFGDATNRQIYANRGMIVLFSALLVAVAAPLPAEYADVNINDLVSLIISLGRRIPSSDGLVCPRVLVDQLGSICRTASQISGDTPEVFLQYFNGSIASESGVNKRSRRYLQRVWDATKQELDPDIASNEPKYLDTDIADSQCQSGMLNNGDLVGHTPCKFTTVPAKRAKASSHWDAMIDEWISMTPARPAWKSNRIVMATPAVVDTDTEPQTDGDTDGPNTDTDDDETAIEESFQSEGPTMVDSSTLHLTPPRKRTRTCNKISDLVLSNSPLIQQENLCKVLIRPPIVQQNRGPLRERRNVGQKRPHYEDEEEEEPYIPRTTLRLFEGSTDYLPFDYRSSTRVNVVIKPRRAPRASRATRSVVWYGEEDELA